MAKRRVKLIEYDRNRLVADIDAGRIIIEPDSVRFHRNRKGRGLLVVGGEDAAD